MKTRTLRKLLLTTGIPVGVLCISTAGAEAAVPAFCPPPGPPPALCAGRTVGDLIVSAEQGLTLGLNTTTGTFYTFSTALEGTGFGEEGATIVLPENPANVLVIGGDSTGVAELDDCGNIVGSPAVPMPTPGYSPSQTLWGAFTLFDPHGGIGGINNRGVAISPLNGDAFSLGFPAIDTGGPPLFSFPPAGGVDSVVVGSGAVMASQFASDEGTMAFDEHGDLFVGVSGSPLAIGEYTAATLATSSPVGTLIPLSGQVPQTFVSLVDDANGSLFLLGTDATNVVGVWKVNAATGASVQLASLGAGIGANFITLDLHGNLWITTTGTSSTVVEVSAATGAVENTFVLPINFGGNVLSATLTGIAVLGENLPVIQKACTPRQFPTLADAVDAATSSVNVNPSGGLTDSYLSCDGAYGGSNVSAHGNVEAATNITVNSGGAIDGTRAPNTASGDAPFAPPAGLTSSGDLNVNRAMTLPAGDYLYGNINVNSGGSITGTGGLVRIWFQHGVNLNGNVTASGNLPENLWLFGLPGSNGFNLNSRVNLIGVIYAPTDTVSVDSGSAVFGAVVGGQVTLNGGKVHFDQVLDGATCP